MTSSAALRLRSTGAALLWRLDTPAGLTAVYVTAFLVRLLLAPHLGFFGDLRYFNEWADRLNDLGLSGFYAPGYFADYPPGYLYVLTFVGAVDPDPGYLSLKLPTILADLALAAIVTALAVRMSSARLRARLPVRAVASLAVLASPAVIGVGAAWGQVDSVPACFVMGSLLLLLTGRPSVGRDLAGMASFAVAIAMKPQSGFLVPVIGYLLIRRYLLTVEPQRRMRSLGDLLLVVVPPITLWAVSGLPFGLSPTGLVSFYRSSAEVLPVTSANAFNLWGAIAFFRGDQDPWKGQPAVTFLGIPSVVIGTLLFLAGTVWVIVRLHRLARQGMGLAASVLWASAAVSMLAFTLLTRMHERYMFPVLALLAPLVILRSFRRYYIVVSLFYVVNLWFPFAYFNAGWRVLAFSGDPWFGWFFGDISAIDTPQKRVWSIIGVILCAILVVLGPRWLEQASGRASVPGRVLPRVRRRLAATMSGQTSSTMSGPMSGTTVGAGIPARVTRFVPWTIVLVAVVWWLGALRGQLRSARTLNDSTFHMQMVRWAVDQLNNGRLALDGWFPDLTLGSSFFHHYQSLPYNITAVISEIVPSDPDSTYRWLLYLLVAAWPIAVYAAARLWEFDRWVAVSAAVIAPLLASNPGYGFELSSYLFGGYGVYTQLFGMWMLPLAWAATWRALHSRGNLAVPTLAVALTIATHLMTGYLAVVSIAVIVLASPSWRALQRGALVLCTSLVTASWVLVPLFADRHHSAQSEYYVGSIFNDSYGAGPIVRWLASGSLYDEGRLPVVTALAVVGVAVCVSRWRSDSRCRSLLLLGAASVILYFGRTTWGSLTRLMPGGGDLQMHRFISGVHMAGIFLAAIGLVAVVRLTADGITDVVRRSGRTSFGSVPARAVCTGVAVAVGIALVTPAVLERRDHATTDAGFIEIQAQVDAADGADVDRLIDEIVRRNDGRGYSGLRGNWGADYRVGNVPVLQQYSHRDTDAIGFTFRTVQALSTDIEVAFDDTNPAQFEMLNVKYLILPAEREPAVPATLLASSGRHRLYEVATRGYIDVVDRVGVIEADRTNLGSRTSTFRSGTSALDGVYPGIAFDGDPVAPATIAEPSGERPGEVISQSHERQNGVYTAEVSLDRPGVVLLKASFDPRWRVTVDGVEQRAEMMAPSLVGVDVTAGQHVVRFEYESYPHYPLLLTLGAGSLIALWFFDRRRTTLRRRDEH